MSCEACDDAQSVLERVSYFRVGTASVQVIGCAEHVAQFYAWARAGMQLMDDVKKLAKGLPMPPPPPAYFVKRTAQGTTAPTPQEPPPAA